MVQYAKFGIECTTEEGAKVKDYKEFKKNCEKYCVEVDMELYYIPIGSETYRYAHELALRYPPAGDIWEEPPDIYISESSIVQTKYDRKDFDRAVAYAISFGNFVYDYEDMSPDEFVGPCCENPSWSIEPCSIQYRNYMIPKSEFGKKKYARLMLGYAVADEIAEELIDACLATKKDFKSITTKKGTHVCYQIMPEHTISGFMDENNARLVDCCSRCGRKRYDPFREPYYMSGKLASGLCGLNRTLELEGPILEGWETHRPNATGRILEPLYITNKDAYNFLKQRCPRMQFIPIFHLEEQ